MPPSSPPPRTAAPAAGSSRRRRNAISAHAAPGLEPVVRRAVHLHQLPQPRPPPDARLTPRLRTPQPLRRHPLPQRLPRNRQLMLVREPLRRERRPEDRSRTSRSASRCTSSPNARFDGAPRPADAISAAQSRNVPWVTNPAHAERSEGVSHGRRQVAGVRAGSPEGPKRTGGIAWRLDAARTPANGESGAVTPRHVPP